ncbi:MAG: restriction endonuclease subunit S [Prevotella sp.]|nr:restriction endonuclease subunit S [Prevotella sp.]
MKEGWEYKKIKDIGSVIGGTTPNTNIAEYWDGNLCWISPAELDGSHYLYDSRKKITEAAVKAKSLKLLPEGTVILSSRAPIGKVVINKVPTYCNQGFKCVVCGKEINNEFLYWWFWGKTEYLNSLGTGATFKEISKKVVEEITIPVPPLSEQQSIVDYLDSAFAKIDAMKANAEKALNEAKALFQASLKEMLEPKEGWEEKTFSDLYDVRDGTHDSPKYHETGYPLVTSKNLRGGILDMSNVSFISEEDYNAINNRSKVDIGDVLFAMIGTIGNPVYVQEKPNYAIKNMALFKVPSNQSGEFLRYYLLNDNVLLKMQNDSKGTTQKFVSLGYLRNFLIKIPSLSEQQSIVATLDSLKSKVDRLQENYDKISQECDALKQAILRQVFE